MASDNNLQESAGQEDTKLGLSSNSLSTLEQDSLGAENEVDIPELPIKTELPRPEQETIKLANGNGQEIILSSSCASVFQITELAHKIIQDKIFRDFFRLDNNSKPTRSYCP